MTDVNVTAFGCVARLARVAAQRVARGDFNEDNPDAVGVLFPHFGQAPGLFGRLAENAGAGRG